MRTLRSLPQSILLLSVAVGVVAACATSPTGRSQLMLVTNAQMTLLGAQAFEEIKKEKPVEADPRANQYIRCIANAVVAEVQSDAAPESWEVLVFRDDTANAFALPSGQIGVHTGLLKVAVTPDQLAAVLGHEVGHVIARHSHERVSTAMAAEGGLSLAGALAGDMDDKKRNMLLGALGVGAQLGILLPYSRTQESEGDVIGLDLMARAGFDPRQALELWENMEKASGAAPPEFLSTHPHPQSRIERLRAHMPDALRTYETARRSGHRPDCTAP